MDFELHPDDFTPASQDEQRLELMEHLERKGLLDRRTRQALEGPEAVDEGWLRPTIRRYHEGAYNLADVVAEIDGRVNQ